MFGGHKILAINTNVESSTFNICYLGSSCLIENVPRSQMVLSSVSSI